MDVHDEPVPAELYTKFLETMPEACVDVVVEHEGAVLLCKRENEPARGEWFWPGSRLCKGEPFEAAAGRVAEEELGLDVIVEEQLGATAHVWETSEQSDDVGRHTVVVVYRVTPTDDDTEPVLDDQHSAYRWVNRPGRGFHEYVRRYFQRWDLPRGGAQREGRES
jgi:colanic acid biosynthesis protein WcaH